MFFAGQKPTAGEMNAGIASGFLAGQKVRPSQLDNLFTAGEKLRAEALNDAFAGTAPNPGPGPGPGPTPGGTPANPGEALWIGETLGKNHFNIGIGGPNGGTDHDDYDDSLIEGGFSQDPEFVLTAEGNVQFRIGVDAGRTSANTQYPRSELRELKEDQSGSDDRAAWNGSSGRHYMKGRSRITNVAFTKPWVCFFQIHDSSSDLVRVQLEGDEGRTNLHVAVRWTPPGGDDEGPVTIMPSYTLGDWIDWEIEISSGTARIWLNGAQVWSRSGMGTSGCYFKAGCYSQSNTDTENGDDSQFFAVEVAKGTFECWHTGYADPTTPVFTG